MQRIGLVIHVRPDRLDEYRKLHNPIWPELAAELKAAGLRNYSLWLQDDGTEFGYVECDDWDAACAYLDKSEVHARWQEMIQDYVVSPQNASQAGQPVQRLRQVFLLE